MIVRILSRGKSFKGLATYLTHDAEQAKTDERVAWTHTLNLANDHVPSAVDEMLWTARNAELLKQEAGVRAGGRMTENSVKHLSLNWAPDDKPTREHMIETTEEFLRHMKWQEHQAILVAHDDKAHAHVHVMLNVVHPEIGLRLNDDFERRRAQAWALEYERGNGKIYCEQRLKTPEEREKSMPRNIWLAFQDNEKSFGKSEELLRQQELNIAEESKNQKNYEWRILKEIQRTERKEFFAEGKLEFKELRLSIYRDVRENFRERWANFYSAQRDGADSEALAALKAELVADQKAVLEVRRDIACGELREFRNERYRELLDDQRQIRAELRGRQQDGLDNTLFLKEIGKQFPDSDIRQEFREAAVEATHPEPSVWQRRADDRPAANEPATVSSCSSDDVGLRGGFSVGSFLDSLFFDLTTLGSAPEEPRRVSRDTFEAAAEETAKHQQDEREDEEAKQRDKERSVSWG
jgi:hypothetical protein